MLEDKISQNNLTTVGGDFSESVTPTTTPIVGENSDDTTSDEIRELLGAPADIEEPLVDSNVFDQKQPAQPIYKSIPLKAGVAAVIGFLVLIPIMGLFSGNLFENLSNGATTPTSQTVEEVETEEQKARRLAEEENTNLKRQLALQNQAFTAEELDASAAEQATQQQTQPSTAAVQPQPAPSAQPVSRPVAAVSPTRAPVRLTPQPVSRPVASRVAPPPAPVPRSFNPPPSFEPPSVNLSEIANAGNFGQLPSRALPLPSSSLYAESQSTSLILASAPNAGRSGSGMIPVSVRNTSSSTAQPSSTKESGFRPMPRVMQEDRKPIETAKEEDPSFIETAEISSNSSRYEEERALIMRNSYNSVALPSNSPTTLLPGSSALLRVQTAITWAADLPQTQGIATLTTPLVSNGYEVLPAGTDLIVQIRAISESGAVALQVLSVVLPGTSDMMALNIPAAALEIFEVDGGYPIATAEQSSEQQLRGIDREQALLGAISGAGSYLNRPESESSFFGIGTSSSTREYGSGSLLGSIMYGAANEMLSSRSVRLEAEAAEIMQRPTIWALGEGRELQIMITQEVML